MTDKVTIGEMLELGMIAENSAQEIYRGFEKLFAYQPEVASFWARYAAEEAGHAQWLQRIRAQASPEQLSALVNPLFWQDAQRDLPLSATELLGQIQNLDDAYEQANKLEHSEINTVFEFLITFFVANEQTNTFLRSQLRDHVARLMFEFPTQFRSAAQRREVQAIQPGGKDG